MNQLIVPQAVDAPMAVVQQLLSHHAMQSVASTALTRRVAALERQAPEMVHAAKEAGAEIRYVGIGGLPAGPMYYQAADGTGWVLVPATTDDDAVMPKGDAEIARRARSILEVGRTYIGHEVAQEQAERIRAEIPDNGLELTAAEVEELVSPIPDPVKTVALGERMEQRSDQFVAGLRRARKLIVGAVTIPVVVAGAAIANAAAGLDPIVVVAVPAGSERPGAPAAWFEITAWVW